MGPDEKTGERTIAFVSDSGSVTPALDDLTSHLAAIGMAKSSGQQNQVRLFDAFPRTAWGKVQKYLLRRKRALP